MSRGTSRPVIGARGKAAERGCDGGTPIIDSPPVCGSVRIGARAAERRRYVDLLRGATNRFATLLVPVMLFTSSLLMALAWLSHLKFKHWPYAQALIVCWLLVLPEYILNIAAIRLGYRFYTGAQMAAFRLCSGVVCVALVARFVLGEELTPRKLVGFGMMIVAMALIASERPDRAAPTADPAAAQVESSRAGREVRGS